MDTYKRIAKSQNTVLEIGASNPAKTESLAVYCKKLVGLEKFKELIPDTKAIKIICGDWRNLKKIFGRQKFDIIVASHVIEHVENDIDCLNESYDVLKKGGYLLVLTPNRNRLAERIRALFFGWRKFPYHEHLREYTKPELKNLILKSSFKKSPFSIKGIVFGLHAGPLYVFLKEAKLFEKYSNFIEVVLEKV